MTVYRIQSKQDRTRGAYRAHRKLDVKPDVVRRMEQTHHGFWDGHPTAKSDIGIDRYVNQDEYCGCPSAASLLQWFKGFIPDLLRAGYEIVALHDVMITAVGKYHVLFKWND